MLIRFHRLVFYFILLESMLRLLTIFEQPHKEYLVYLISLLGHAITCYDTIGVVEECSETGYDACYIEGKNKN